MKLTPMKAVLCLLATALGAAALLVACGAGDGSDSRRLSAGVEGEDDCTVCLLFDLDSQLDDD